MGQMNIVIATLLPASGETGVQTHFNEFAAFLRSQGRPPAIVSAYGVNRWLTRLHSVPARIVRKFDHSAAIWWNMNALKGTVALQLRRALRDARVGAIYAQDVLSAAAALSVRRSREQRVVAVTHFNGDLGEELSMRFGIPHSNWLCSWLKQEGGAVLRRVDGIIYVSKFVRDAVQADKITTESVVLPNFVSEAQPVDFSFSNDMISIGSLETRKNQEYLLWVLAEARNLGYRYTLTLIGQGDDEPKLQRVARNLGVAEQVTFCGFQARAARFIAAHRIYVSSALVENLPISMLEAMAAGIPILATEVGGIREVFSDGVEGFYWRLNDPKQGASKLIEVLENRQLHQRLSRAARARFLQSFSTSTVAPRLEEFVLRGRTERMFADAHRASETAACGSQNEFSP